MDKNTAGVQDNTPIISLNPNATNKFEQFNISEDRHDEIEIAIRRAMRNLRKGNPVSFSSDKLVTEFVKIAKTPEELAYLMLQAGETIRDLSNLHNSIADALGPDLAHLLGRAGKGKVTVKRGNIEDLLNHIMGGDHDHQ